MNRYWIDFRFRSFHSDFPNLRSCCVHLFAVKYNILFAYFGSCWCFMWLLLLRPACIQGWMLFYVYVDRLWTLSAQFVELKKNIFTDDYKKVFVCMKNCDYVSIDLCSQETIFTEIHRIRWNSVKMFGYFYWKLGTFCMQVSTEFHWKMYYIFIWTHSLYNVVV